MNNGAKKAVGWVSPEGVTRRMVANMAGVSGYATLTRPTGSVRVKFICRLGYGDSLPKDEEFDGDVPVFGLNGQYASTSVRNTDVPAIVVGRKGSYGKVNWASNGCFASDTTFFVDERLIALNLRWLYWSLQSVGRVSAA